MFQMQRNSFHVAANMQYVRTLGSAFSVWYDEFNIQLLKYNIYTFYLKFLFITEFHQTKIQFYKGLNKLTKTWTLFLSVLFWSLKSMATRPKLIYSLQYLSLDKQANYLTGKQLTHEA